MAQLGYGMRQLLDQIEAELNDLIHDKNNPYAVEEHAHKLKRRMNEEVAPRLMRAEPTVEAKIKELEDRHRIDMDDMKARLERVEQQKIIVVKEL